MPAYVSPGVYTREIDLSLYVPSLSTTAVGMVGVTSKGPVQERTYISNQQQFIETFGAPDDTLGYEAYAALQYLRQGRQLWFVRVVGTTPVAASATFYYEDTEAGEEIHAGLTIAGKAASSGAGIAGAPDSGTVFSELGDDGIVPGSVTLYVTAASGTFEVVEATDDGEGVLEGIGTTLEVAGTINYETGAWTITTDENIKATTAITADYSYYVDAFVAEANSVGEWGNDISVAIEAGTVADTVKLSVYYGGIRQEQFNNLDLDENSANFIETRINDISDYITVTADAGLAGTEVAAVTAATLLSGGDTDASTVNAAAIVGVAWDALLGQATGLNLFASAYSVDINLLAAPGWYDAAVVNAMIQICEARHDCMAIIDPPNDLNPSEVVDWHNGEGTYDGVHAAFNSSYAACYYPWIKVYDAANRQYVFTPPSGHVLAVYAYTDYNAETWFAPAGLQRGRVISGVDTAYDITPGEMDLLYGDGNVVNPIVNFNQQGIVVWGQRTMQRASTALDRVNVRRLLLYLRKAIATASAYLVFEPNDEKTWKLFGHLVVPYLNDVRQRRGLYDFRVKCDETTNTPVVIDRNEMRAQILLKPVKAAEFIQIDFVLTTTGANFEEVLY